MVNKIMQGEVEEQGEEATRIGRIDKKFNEFEH